ncbi:hypothetical protein MKX03_032046 [Papaver bracteatum]|nr:hypothetical protein MKX03_032046 [Papaver bracteatum]
MAADSSSTSPAASEKMKNLRITESTKEDKPEVEEVVVSGSAEKSENEVGSLSPSTKSEKKRMIILKSADDKEFEVEESILMISKTLKHIIEDGCDGNEVPIPLPNVTGELLEKVIVFLKRHAPAMEFLYGPDAKNLENEEFEKAADDLMNFDTEFIKGIESDQMIFDLIFAGNYLGIKNLMDLTCEVVARKMMKMTPDQVRDYLRIENDYTPEQEAKVRADHAWAFQGE